MMKAKLMLMCAAALVGGSVASAAVVPIDVDLEAELYGDPGVQVNMTDGAGFSGSSWHVNIPAGVNKLFKWVAWTPEGGPLAGYNVGDIENISYYTKDGNVSDAKDWYLQIYTLETGSGDASSWFKNRLTTEPGYLSQANAGDTDDTWVKWDTSSADANTKLKFYSQASNPASALDFDALKVAHGGEAIKGLAINSGDTGGGWAYEGSISSLEVAMNDGTVYQYSFVPEPASIALLGLGGLALLRRRK
ncbi:PEP-CTERM sorting domain-containing protein [Planctomycetota bacterium]|nr:PEP-CTERM sorting domain-containing protein [Planctomycetota bacterium]